MCDEPLSALDVSVQAAILNLLVDLQKRSGTAYMFISHDLSVVRYLSDLVAVMYMGKLAEIGTPEEVFVPPYHPYTEALLSAISIPDPMIEQASIRLEGTGAEPGRPRPRLPLRVALPAQDWGHLRERGPAGARAQREPPALLPHPAGGVCTR